MQRGNNNAWCQDNDLSWFDWRLCQTNRDMLLFVRELIALRRRHACLSRNRFYTGTPVPGRSIADVAWHGAQLNQPPWFDGQAQFLAFTLAGLSEDEADLHVLLNMSERTVEAALPSLPGRPWHLALDTSQPQPRDVLPPSSQRPHPASYYAVGAHSVVVLEAHPRSAPVAEGCK
jgi:isoamylase